MDVHKNRRNPLDPVVVSFKVKGVPKYDIPKPVMLKKKAEENKKDQVKNIPCPYDNCEELLSRQEFRDHLNNHREQIKSSQNVDNVETGGMENKSPEFVSNNEIVVNTDEEDYSSVVDGESSNVKCEEEQDQSDVTNVTLDQSAVTEDSVEIVETKSGDNSLNKLKQTEKQSTILSFFQRFDPRPKDEVKEIYSKKSRTDLLSPTFKSTPKARKLGKNKSSGASDKKAPNIVEHFANISTPVNIREASSSEKKANTTKVITSPLGFFKIDQSLSVNEPNNLEARGTEVKRGAEEEPRQDKYFKHFRY